MSNGTVMCDYNTMDSLYLNCTTLSKVVTAVLEDRTKSMCIVVYLLTRVFSESSPSQEEVDEFISDIERLCEEKKMQRVPLEFIDLVISPLQYSKKNGAENLVSLLTRIRQNTVLSSNGECIFAHGDKRIELSHKEYKVIYTMDNPGKCTKPGKCGFIIQRLYHSHHTRNVTLELITDIEHYVDTDDYVDTGVHCHDIIPERVCVYSVCTLILPDADCTKVDTVAMPGSWCRWWWYYWFQCSLLHPKLELKCDCVAFSMSDIRDAK